MAQGIAATGAQLAAHDIGTQPHPARFAQHVNALHGATGQILHRFFSCGRKQNWIELPCAAWTNRLARILQCLCCGVKEKAYNS
jgi:hypothetical protein